MTVELGQKISFNPIAMTGGKNFVISDYKGKNIVLYFYPKDNTPGCTTESIGFTERHAAFTKNNTVVFGVSKDTLKSHEKFKAEYSMPFELIADTDKILCNAFGVLREKNMFGKKYLGIERSTFVIDGEGILIQAWRKVSVPGHVSQVLSFVKTLQKELH